VALITICITGRLFAAAAMSPAAPAALVSLASAVPERAPTPSAALHRSPHQLEVTVLSVEEKAGLNRDRHFWHRVRVDRVLAGSGLVPGNEVAVVSVVHHNPPGATGSSGDRGPFRGPNGLPLAGDRARLFAEGGSEILRPTPPNGWQAGLPHLAFLAADDEDRAGRAASILASAVKAVGFAETAVHTAKSGGGGLPDDASRANDRVEFEDSHRLNFIDATVLAVGGALPARTSARGLGNALDGGLPIVALRRSYAALDRSTDGAAPESTAATAPHTATRPKTRVLPPESAAAAHPILAGVAIPEEGIIVSSRLILPRPEHGAWPADRQVLLWAVACDPSKDDAPLEERQPLLWVWEVPREERGRGGSGSRRLPPQRLAATTLGGAADFDDPEVRVALVQMIAWAIGREHLMTDEARRKVRESARDTTDP